MEPVVIGDANVQSQEEDSACKVEEHWEDTRIFVTRKGRAAIEPFVALGELKWQLS